MKKLTLMLIVLVAVAAMTLSGCGGGGSSSSSGTAPPVTPNDADGDGVNDAIDAFPNDAAASVDTDRDGFPDFFNPNATDAQLDATTLLVDEFYRDPAAAIDTDGDHKPNDWLPTATQAQIDASDLIIDDDDDNDGVLDVDDAAPLRGIADIPTERPVKGEASPLFGAQAFTQTMIRFEEFGPEDMPKEEIPVANWLSLPQPLDAQSGSDPVALENFLAQDGVWPLPQRLSNVAVASPWKSAIEAYLGRPLVMPAELGLGVAGPAEGRPSGEDWAHQRWEELYPAKFYKTAVAPARDNGGFRDAKQRHEYKFGEFAPGGLYHQVFATVPGEPTLNGTTAGVAIKFHPNMPVQHPNSIWTFDGTLPPKLLLVRYGEPILMRNYNALPISPEANNGFGRHTISTHEHNGHSPGESDGFAGAFFYPGQYYDYRWPLQLAGFSEYNNAAGAVNYDATDPRAAIPCEDGESFSVLVNGEPVERTCQDGRVMIPGDWRETMSTHWFHDHMLDHTAENVYKGNATIMNYFSALDRGNEAIDDGVNLRFPSGTDLNWGNRDYDINMVVADKAWDAQGQLWFNTAQHDGYLGDQMLVNWLYKPYFDVRARKYRFRVLNGSVSRIMAIGVVHEVVGDGGEFPGPEGSGVSYNRVPFHMIANDGNILEHAVPFDGSMDLDGDGDLLDHKGQLPSQSIAERYDIIIDFSKHGIAPGDKVYFVNFMEHEDGRGSKSKVPLAEILSGEYQAIVKPDTGQWINGDPAVGKFLELRVHAYEGEDLSMDPAEYVAGGKKMIPLAIDREAKTVNGVSLLTARHHTFEFVHGQGSGGHGTPWFIKVDGGERNLADPARVSAITHGDLEVYTIKTGRGWTHPVHIHFEEGIILSRGGKAPPEWEMWARKDMYRIGPEDDSTGTVEVAFRSRDFLGHYVQHCHNTMHEDHAMLLRWDARTKGSRLIDTPMPTWDGVYYDPSFALPLADVGDGIGPGTNLD
jgi:FtsP/CotA-like multicopper oxidase with cupredoxin domain